MATIYFKQFVLDRNHKMQWNCVFSYLIANIFYSILFGFNRSAIRPKANVEYTGIRTKLIYDKYIRSKGVDMPLIYS